MCARNHAPARIRTHGLSCASLYTQTQLQTQSHELYAHTLWVLARSTVGRVSLDTHTQSIRAREMVHEVQEKDSTLLPAKHPKVQPYVLVL